MCNVTTGDLYVYENGQAVIVCGVGSIIDVLRHTYPQLRLDKDE